MAHIHFKMLPSKLVEEAREFVRILRCQPELLHASELKFLRDYLERYFLTIFIFSFFSLGAKIPPPKSTHESPPKQETTHEKEEPESPESEESDLGNCICNRITFMRRIGYDRCY